MTDNVTCSVISTFMSSERSQFYFHSLILPLSLYVHSRNQLTDFLGANESLESILRDIFCCCTLLFSSSTLHFLWQGYYTRKRKRGRQRERERKKVCAHVWVRRAVTEIAREPTIEQFCGILSLESVVSWDLLTILFNAFLWKQHFALSILYLIRENLQDLSSSYLFIMQRIGTCVVYWKEGWDAP